MLVALSARNKMAFINGSLPKPPSTDPDSKAWERCNDLIITWMLRSLDASIAHSVLYLTTAAEIWTDLTQRFGQGNGSQLFLLQQKLNDIKQGPHESVAEFFTKIKVIWDEISGMDPLPQCSCGGCSCSLTKQFLKIQQDQRLIQFLMKLDSKFHQVRSNILLMQPLPQVSTAYGLITQDEHH